MACCIGLAAEISAPDADALSIILPSGNGNATQINILEGNIFNPQFGRGGDGSNTSHNSTIGNLMFGLGNKRDEGTSGGGIFGPIALGGATGNGNVTQINILSYNIFNPQVSLKGGNISNNTTVNNVAIGNGNGSTTTADATGGASTFLGGALGNGNTTQLSFFSGNIFNPQFSLFGNNISNNTAITNVSAYNGRNSIVDFSSGGFFGSSLFGTTGNGNSTQVAGFTSNIFNPQFSLLGGNLSRNYSNTNQASNNGGGSSTGVGSSGGGLGNNTTVGTTGNGNVSQYGWGTGNIYNKQWRLGLGSLVPGLTPAPTTSTVTQDVTQTSQDGTQTTQDVVDASGEDVTNAEVTGGGGPGLTNQELLDLQNQQPGSSSSTGTVVAPRPLKEVGERLKNAVDETLDRITKPRKPAAGTGTESTPAQTNSDGS